MPNKKLEAEIAQIKKELATDLPADVKSSLQKALSKAEQLLKEGAQGPKPVKKERSENNKPAPVRTALDDCQEILAQHKREKKKAATRRERRQKAGKPPELTVPETIKKTARTVKKKVEKNEENDREYTITDLKAIRKSLFDVVRPILDSLPKKKQAHFAEMLAVDIDMYIHNGFVVEADGSPSAPKHEKGGRIGDTDQEGQLQIFHYTTRHFDRCPEARTYFARLLAEPAAEQRKDLIMAMARDVDDVLAKVYATGKPQRVTREAFLYATGHLMRAMYWSYGIVEGIGMTGDPQPWYPGFLAGELYKIADRLEQTAPPADLSAYEDPELAPPISENLPEFPADADDVEFAKGGKLQKIPIKVSIEGKELNVDIHAYHQVQTALIKELKASHRSYDDMKKHLKQCYQEHVHFASGTSEADKEKVVEHFVIDTLGKAHGFKGLFKKGGKITFNDKVKAIAANLRGKTVPPKYQKTEGKRFTKKTAEEAARRIAGKRQQQERRQKMRAMIMARHSK